MSLYLRAAWPILHTLAAGVNDVALRPASRLNGVPALDAVAASYDAAMSSEQAFRDLKAALGAIGWPEQPLGAGDKSDAAIAAARTLINKVGDGSNLILDPDLDSYYVMDVVLLKLPEAIDQARVLLTLAATYKARATLNDDEKAQILIRAGQFAAAVDGIASSFDAAYRSNGDGQTKPALQGPAAAFARASADYLAAVNAAATVLRGDDRSKLDIGNLKRLHDGALTASDQLWKTAATELERLLVVRIGGFKTKLWSALAVSLGTTLLALLFAWSLAGSIIRAIRGLVAGVDQLREGDMNAAVPHADGRDEIADVARAVARFRDHAIGVLTEANSAEREEAIRRTQREALAGIAEEVRGSVAGIANRLDRLGPGHARLHHHGRRQRHQDTRPDRNRGRRSRSDQPRHRGGGLRGARARALHQRDFRPDLAGRHDHRRCHDRTAVAQAKAEQLAPTPSRLARWPA